MINVLIPAMGKSLFFKESFFPKPVIDVAGETMLERVVKNYNSLNQKKFVFIFDRKDCAEFHLDESAGLLTEPNSDVLILENETAGALCSCLMAIEKIDLDSPLFISNCDQVIDINYQKVFEYFNDKNADAGVIIFNSIHPRWSYARIKNGEVVEVAEKRPLSKNAIAGFYYYRKARDFITSAEKAVLKDENYNGKYYISSTMNEIILMGGKVVPYEIQALQYHSFYSPEKIKEYERFLQGKLL